MKHICLDARMLFSSGIGTYLQNLIKGLEESPLFSCTLLLRKEDYYYKTSHQKKVFKAPIYSLQEQLAFPHVIEECDLFWSPHFNIPIRKIKAKKRLVTIHDVYHLAHFSSLSLLQKMYAQFFYTKASSLSDKIVTVSHFSKQEIEKYIASSLGKVEVIYLGVDSSLFTREEKKTQYQLPERFLLYVGNIKPNKNVKLLLQAFAKMSHKQNLSVVIVSNSSSEDQKKLMQEFDVIRTKVHFYSGVKNEELCNFYQKAEAFVFPSYYEGFGFPPLEAMSCGCPVLASCSASIPEVCEQSAFYFDPYSETSLLQAIQKMMHSKEEKERLIQKGSKRVSFFTWEKSIQHYKSLLEKMLY